MKYKELEHEYKLMIKRYNSICDAVGKLEDINTNLFSLTEKLKADIKEMQVRSNTRERIINQEIQKMNAQHNTDLEEIRELRAKVNVS